MKYNRNLLSSSIKYALLAGTVGVGLAATSVFAQESDDSSDDSAAMDKITVTGSRIRQPDVEGATPITVITREDIEYSGYASVSDVLRNSVFNSFGSFTERSGSSGGQAATVSMRGLGSDHTAVLINGRRLPGTPLFGTTSANLNALPIAAVERIEILTDGASAIYGADAIAGVVNIILRSDYEGAEATIGIGRPTQQGRDEANGNFIVGGSGDKGNFVFSLEYFKTDPLFDADRDYTKVKVLQEGGVLGVDTIGISGFGNTAFPLFTFASAVAVGDCQTTADGGLYAGVFTDPFGIPGTTCGFGYADISAQRGKVERTNSFLSANYEINDNVNLYVQNTVARIESFGRYAPVAAGFIIDPTAEFDPFPGQGPIYLAHRFVGHGPRDENFTEFDIDTLIGINGIVGDSTIEYDLYARYYTVDIANIGTNYVVQAAIEEAVRNGSYNFLNPADPANADAILATKHTNTRDLKTTYTEVAFNLNGFAFDLPAGQIGWAAGIEYADESYQDVYDAEREAGLILGSAGSSAAGSRKRGAIFGEASVPILDSLEARLAVRYDDYDDFGSEVSPQVALRWQPIDSLMLRASWGEGFKAPNLSALHAAVGDSFNNVRDFTQCRAQGIPDQDCATFQVRNFSGGNPGLKAETSSSYNLGFSWEAFDGFSIGADYYSTDLDDAITQIGLQTLINLEADGLPLPPGTSINRGADVAPGVPGRINTINTGFANVATLTVEGIDTKINYVHSFDSLGSINAGLIWAHLTTYDFTSLPGGDAQDQLGIFQAPEDRGTFDVRWSLGDHTVSWNILYIGSTESSGGSDAPKIDSFWSHNVTYTYSTPWNGIVTLGLRNVFDEDPPLDKSGDPCDDCFNLYDTTGRVPFVQYTQKF